MRLSHQGKFADHKAVYPRPVRMWGQKENQALGKNAPGQRDAWNSSRSLRAGWQMGMYKGPLCDVSAEENRRRDPRFDPS